MEFLPPIFVPMAHLASQPNEVSGTAAVELIAQEKNGFQQPFSAATLPFLAMVLGSILLFYGAMYCSYVDQVLMFLNL